VAVCVSVDVTVPDTDAVFDGVCVNVDVTVPDTVAVLLGVCVIVVEAVLLEELDAVTVGDPVILAILDVDAVLLGVGVLVDVRVGVLVDVLVEVPVLVCEGVPVGVPDLDGVLVDVPVPVDVCEGVAVGVPVPVA